MLGSHKMAASVGRTRRGMMLLVIFGAGASYDGFDFYNSINPGKGREGYKDSRLPLAKDLFSERRIFTRALESYPRAANVIGELRPRIIRGANVEEELERLESEAENVRTFLPDLAAIRFYLRQAIWDCEQSWFQITQGVTNYVSLLRDIERWRNRAREKVCLVTFNYDTVLEHACRQTLGLQLDAPGHYISHDDYKIFKPHGSINWGHSIWEFPSNIGGDRPAAQWLIANYGNYKIADEKNGDSFVGNVSSADDVRRADRLIFPAIAIPTLTKADFECPPNHIDQMRTLIPQARWILIIGWRGTEKHFLDILAEAAETTERIQIVAGGEPEAGEVIANLIGAGVQAENIRYQPLPWGFTEYLDGHFVELLS